MVFFRLVQQLANENNSIPEVDVSADAIRTLASETSLTKIYNKLSEDVSLRKYVFSSLGIPTDTEYPKLFSDVIFGDLYSYAYYPDFEDTLYIADDIPNCNKAFYRILASLFDVRVDEYPSKKVAAGHEFVLAMQRMKREELGMN